MVSMTVSVSPQIRALMAQFPEINWSGFVGKAIAEKARELAWQEEMLKKLKQEQGLDDWAAGLQKTSRAGRFKALKAGGQA